MFWFRMAVPLKLRPIVNKCEEKCSLGTRDSEGRSTQPRLASSLFKRSDGRRSG
ncbi:DUF6538 domain-containing protein [Bradyrhizobium embrapense]